jgi:transcriptional regulator with XRE-family HTH domain
MMRKSYAYVRAHRRKWGLTQVELAQLMGLSSRSAVSRIERADRVPTTATVIACGIIFGIASPELFPSLHEQVERTVIEAVATMEQELVGRTDKLSQRKRALLVSIRERIISQDQKHKP